MNIDRTRLLGPRPRGGSGAHHPLRRLLPLVGLAFVGLAACEDDPADPVEPTTFEVTLENTSADYGLIASGAFDTPVGESAAGPAGSGMAYEASFAAGVGHRLFFATMFVQSNDLFYAPGEAGIELYDGAGMPVTGRRHGPGAAMGRRHGSGRGAWRGSQPSPAAGRGGHG